MSDRTENGLLLIHLEDQTGQRVAALTIEAEGDFSVTLEVGLADTTTDDEPEGTAVLMLVPDPDPDDEET